MVHGFHLTQENVTKKVRILDVVYNATSNELVPCLADVGDSWLILKNGVISKNRPRNWALSWCVILTKDIPIDQGWYTYIHVIFWYILFMDFPIVFWLCSHLDEE